MVGSFSIGDRVRYLPPWPSDLTGTIGTVTNIGVVGTPTVVVSWNDDTGSVVLIDCLGPAPAEATIVGNELRLDDTNTPQQNAQRHPSQSAPIGKANQVGQYRTDGSCRSVKQFMVHPKEEAWS
jgi:hypothetical protein